MPLEKHISSPGTTMISLDTHLLGVIVSLKPKTNKQTRAERCTYYTFSSVWNIPRWNKKWTYRLGEGIGVLSRD
jgi:hypothetical protein